MPPYGFADGAPTFGSYAGLVAGLRTPGARALLTNPLSPTGDTEMYYNGKACLPVPKQCLVELKNADGVTPLLDLTATALSIGAWNEVWQSPALPDWMVQNGQKLSLGADGSVSDAANTATEKLRICLRPTASAGGDENDGALGHAASGVQYGRGLSAIVSTMTVGSNGVITGSPASGVYKTGDQARRTVGFRGVGTTRIRLDAWPGAATNVIRLYSVSIYSE